MGPYDDEDESRDKILEMLGGEVDDYAGSQLKNPDEKEGTDGSQGVTIEISVKPHGAEASEPKPMDEKEMPGEDDEHDMIGHVLGMHGGGCAY